MFLLAKGVKIGIIVGVLLFLALLGFLIFDFLYDKRHRHHL